MKLVETECWQQQMEKKQLELKVNNEKSSIQEAFVSSHFRGYQGDDKF